MDGTFKQLIAVGLVCALLGGIIGGVIVSFKDDTQPCGQAFATVSTDPDNPKSMYLWIYSSEEGNVDIYYKNYKDKPFGSYKVKEGSNFFSIVAPTTYTLDDSTIRCIWRPL